IQVLLGAAGLLTSLLLALGLIAATRRQTAHFRSLVTSSTDLVLVFGDGGCRYVSRSVANMLGRPEEDLLGEGFARFVHPDDLASVCSAHTHGEPHEIVFRMVNEFDEWRHLEAHVTDLGPDLGDQLLEEVAGRFDDIIRPADTLARLGGDEFALLLEGTQEPQAVAAAKRLLRRLSEPIGLAGHELALGASIGVAIHPGG